MGLASFEGVFLIGDLASRGHVRYVTGTQRVRKR